MTATMPIDAPWWWVPPRPEPPPDERVPPLIRGLLGAFLFEAGYLGMVDADGTVWEERWRSFGSRNAADLIRAAAQTDLALEVLIGQRGTLAPELIERLADVAGIDDAQSVHDAVRDTLHVDDLPDRVLRDGLKRARQIIAREGRRNKRTRGSLTMGAPCNTCRHPRRDEIERAYLADVLSKSAIVRKFRIGGKHEASSRRCLNHHMAHHVSAEDKQRILLDLKRTKEQQIATELSEVADDDIEIKGGLKRIVREIDGILQRAKANNDDGMALTALRDMRGTLLDLAKIMGQLREVSTVEVRIADAPQWQQLREILGQVFAEHPEAGAAFLRRTRQLKLTFDGDA